MRSPQQPSDTTLDEALGLLRCGDAAQGTAALERIVRSDPDCHAAAGHLAWEYLHKDYADKALPLYENLARSFPESREALTLRALARIITCDERSVDGCRRECTGIDFRAVPHAVAVRLLERVLMTGDSALIVEVAKKALRAHPGDTDFQRVVSVHTQRLRRRRMRRLAELTGMMGLLRYLLRFGSIRGLVVNEMGSATPTLQGVIEEFYARGSGMAVFPQSRDDETPERFHHHFKMCDCAYFKWFCDSCDLLRPGTRMVDVGCGPGFVAHHFQSIGMEVTAVSGSFEELDECRRRGFRTVHAEMHAMPLESGAYDFVLASHVLEHSVAPMLLLYEMKRLLKPGGKILIDLPHPIDAEPRRDFPESWDETTGSYRFEGDLRYTGKNPYLSYYSYGFPPHIFVLTYWQWRWVFWQSGLRTLSSGIDIGGRGVVPPTEDLLKDLRDRPHCANMVFILEPRQP